MSRPSTEPRERVNVMVPHVILAELRKVYGDPFTRRMKYGKMSAIVTEALRAHLRILREKGVENYEREILDRELS